MNSKKYNFIYLTLNKINLKCYVGSHSTNNINDKYLGSGTLFIKALKKNKSKNFIRIILKQYNNIIEARKNETYYINLFDTLYPNGYNLDSHGGNGYPNASLSPEAINKISIFRKGKTYEQIMGIKKANKLKKEKSINSKGEKNIMYNKSLYDVWVKNKGKEYADIRLKEYCEKMSNSLKGKSKKNKHNYKGFKGKHTLDSIEKMKKSHKGSIPWNKNIKTNTPSWNNGMNKEEQKYYRNLSNEDKILYKNNKL